MEIANGQPIPDRANVALYVPFGKQIPKGGPCERIDQDALRCDEDGISVTWLEYFEGTPTEQLWQAAHALKGSLGIKKSAIIATTSVEKLKGAASKLNRDICVVRDEQPDNKAHCLVRGVAAADFALLMQLATAFSPEDFTSAGDIPGLVG